jgi:anti-sigma B factor antagonist
MVTHPLEASVRHHSGVAIIDLCGEIDGDAEDAMETAYTSAEQENPTAILLNFKRVTYINSKGIALIVLLLARAQKSGHRLLACSLTDHFKEIFDITRLSDYIGVCDNENTALDKVLALGTILQKPPEEHDVEARRIH